MVQERKLSLETVGGSRIPLSLKMKANFLNLILTATILTEGLNLFLSWEEAWWLNQKSWLKILEKTATIDPMKVCCFVSVMALLFIDYILISKILASTVMGNWKMDAIFSNMRQSSWLLALSPIAKSWQCLPGSVREVLLQWESFKHRNRNSVMEHHQANPWFFFQ